MADENKAQAQGAGNAAMTAEERAARRRDTEANLLRSQATYARLGGVERQLENAARSVRDSIDDKATADRIAGHVDKAVEAVRAELDAMEGAVGGTRGKGGR